MNDIVKFGEIIGITEQNVIAYSNNNNKSTSNYYNKIYTGLKYECVEFVRRWLIIVYNITFKSVNNAKDIFDLANFYTTSNPSHEININKCINGISSGICDISFGDLIIWDYKGEFSLYGHVAVVVKIKKKYIYIAEQNTCNKSWNGKKYSRKLLFDNNILEDLDYPDTKILGWIKYKN